MVNNCDLIVVGPDFSGSITAFNFLEQSKKDGKNAGVALVEVEKKGERCGDSRWTMAYCGSTKSSILINIG
jgi:hypothetical protein